MVQRNSTYVEQGESFDRDMDYIPDRITRDSTYLAGRARSLPPRGRPGLPVGQPRDHRAQAARARGRDLDGPVRSGARPGQLDLRPRPGRRRPGARHPPPQGGVRRARPRLPARHHRAGDGRHPHRSGGHQRLPVDHPRPVLRVAGAPPPRRARPLAGRLSRGDGRRHAACVHRGEQRRLPVRVRRLAGGVRRGLRPPLGDDGLARGPAGRSPLPDGVRRSPRPTYACSRRWRASTRSTTATSSATATS